MADFTFGVTKTNGFAGFDEALTLSMDFWTLTFNMNILTATDASGLGTSLTQAALNKIVEIISERGQPVIMNNPTFNSTTGVSTLKFAIEHKLSWNTNEGNAPVYGLGAAGAATDNGAAALEAKLIADGINICYQSSYAAWAAGTVVAGTVVTNATNYYLCVVGGTAATAPTGTGSTGTAAISPGDGTVWWYLGAVATATPPAITYLVNTPVYSSSLI
jgi:hypothetical protein